MVEINAIEHRPMYMNDYVEQLDAVLSSGNRRVLHNAGRISYSQAMKKAKEEYQKYQATMISPVEDAYLKTVKTAVKVAKQACRRNEPHLVSNNDAEMHKTSCLKLDLQRQNK